MPEAMEFHAAAVLEGEAILGSSHIETLTAMYWLAIYWILEGRFSDADAYLQRVYIDIVEAKGEDHWSAQRARILLKRWRYYMDRVREADEAVSSDTEL